MKKLLLILICVCILAAMALPALAAEEIKVVIAPTKTEVNRGDTISFAVGLEGSVSFTTLYISLSFPENVFEFVSAEKAENLHGFTPDLYSKDHPEIGLVSLSPSTFEGTIQTITFKVKADAKIGKVEVAATPEGAQCNGGNITVKAAKVEVTVACKHNYETWTKVDDDTHKAVCGICNEPKTEKHTWDGGKITTTSGCEDPGEKTYTCTACGAEKKEPVAKTGHAWDNDCDTDCNNKCGTTRTITHKYADKFTSDEKGHWYPCTVCGDKKDYYEHTPDRDAATEKEAQLCKICGYVIADKLAHVHDVSPQIQKDAEGHWYYCSKYGCYMRIDLAAHVYDNDCDMDCNVCAYIRIPPHKYRPEWRGSAEGHWRVCALCEAQSEISPHNPGEPATQDNPQLCVDCNFWLQWPLSHVHSYNEGWEQEENGHWQICKECQAHSEIQEHNWDEGTVTLEPTDTHEGTKAFVCTVCLAEKTESIPMLDPTEPSEPAQPSYPHTPGDPVEEDGFPWWILAASAGVLLVVGIVLLVIELIRSRKTNMHGKFSK